MVYFNYIFYVYANTMKLQFYFDKTGFGFCNTESDVRIFLFVVNTFYTLNRQIRLKKKHFSVALRRHYCWCWLNREKCWILFETDAAFQYSFTSAPLTFYTQLCIQLVHAKLSPVISKDFSYIKLLYLYYCEIYLVMVIHNLPSPCHGLFLK